MFPLAEIPPLMLIWIPCEVDLVIWDVVDWTARPGINFVPTLVILDCLFDFASVELYLIFETVDTMSLLIFLLLSKSIFWFVYEVCGILVEHVVLTVRYLDVLVVFLGGDSMYCLLDDIGTFIAW